jgi:hypothetical protein
MKTTLLIKVLLGLPLILIVDWVLMTVFGCGASFMGAGNDFFCGTYCLIGKGVLLLSAVLFLSLFVPEIKKFLIHKKNAETS